jgi:death-on-curing protein
LPPVFLTLAEVVEIHRDQIERYGGRPGIRDAGLLESAVAMPQAAMGGQYLHADLFEMAAAYLFHLVKNHPFVDGNKRTGAVVAFVFLEVNGIEVALKEDELVETVLSVAEGRKLKPDVAALLRTRVKKPQGK